MGFKSNESMETKKKHEHTIDVPDWFLYLILFVSICFILF